jgi:hypothetical protein
MQNKAGGGTSGGGMSSGQAMSSDGMNPLQPQDSGEMPSPQTPMSSSIDASVGRAASGDSGFFPN